METSDLEDIALFSMFLMIHRISKRRNSGKKRRFWVRQLFKQREQCGVFNSLIQEMRFMDREAYFR